MKPTFYLGVLFAGVATVLLTSSAASSAETIAYKYDARGRLVEVKRTGAVNNNVTTKYTHDKANNRKTLLVTGSPNTPAP